MDAITTNAATNALHASFLFSYFAACLYYTLKGSEHFKGLMVCMFFSFFMIKMIGIVVHYWPTIPNIDSWWQVAAITSIFGNYCMVHAMGVSERFRAIIVFSSLLFVALYIVTINYFFLAIMMVVIYTAVGYKTSGWLRLGLWATVASNITWIILRKAGEAWYGGELPLAYRYENDVYHLLLIISTFIFYKSIAHGDWPK